MGKRKQQSFAPVCDGVRYRICCTPHPWRRYLEISIDEQAFRLPWGAREEIFRLGETQAVLCVDKRGGVRIRLRDGEVPECDAQQLQSMSEAQDATAPQDQQGQ